MPNRFNPEDKASISRRIRGWVALELSGNCGQQKNVCPWKDSTPITRYFQPAASTPY